MIFYTKKPFYKNLYLKKKNIFKNRKIFYKDKNYILYKFVDIEEGNFLLLKKDKKFFFIKKIDYKNNFENLKFINNFLEKRKIKIPKTNNFPFLNKILNRIGFKYFLIFEYIQSTFKPNQISDFKLLSKSLVELHKAFKKFPQRKLFKKNTIKRMKFLKKNVEKFNKLKLNNDTKLYKVQKILKNNFFLFDNFKKNLINSSVIHGDLIPGNLINYKNSFYFVDFEDCFFSFFLIDLDLAIIIERMILLKKIPNKKKLKQINFFLKFYSKFFKSKTFLSQDLYSSLKFINLRALTTLVVSNITNQKIFDQEITKFLYLFNLTEKNKTFLKKIDNYVKK